MWLRTLTPLTVAGWTACLTYAITSDTGALVSLLTGACATLTVVTVCACAYRALAARIDTLSARVDDYGDAREIDGQRIATLTRQHIRPVS